MHPGISTSAKLRKPDVAVAQVGVNATILNPCYTRYWRLELKKNGEVI